MLRDFVYEPHAVYIQGVLERFDINSSESFAILRFEVITPDSFMWRLSVGGYIHYLYAEDYVSGLEYIKTVFSNYLEDDQWELVKAKHPITFDDSSPVQGAVTYKKTKDSSKMMQYAVDSRIDFLFLARSNEEASDALFSEAAPRGFKAGY